MRFRAPTDAHYLMFDEFGYSVDRIILKNRVIRVLAQSLLASDWEPDEMLARTLKIFASKPRWLKSLIARTIEQYPTAPDFLTLEEFFAADIKLQKTLKKSTPIIPNLLLPAPAMRPAAGNPRNWNLPPLNSIGQLADWLNISWQRLEWLAGTRPVNQSSELHYHTRWIRKKRIGFRLIESPKAQLKQIQRQILVTLLNEIPVHERSHGFCAQRNVLTYVQPHIGQQYCLKMDLRHFFPSTQAGRVFRIFRTAGYPIPVARVLTGLCTKATSRKVMQQRDRMIGSDGGLQIYALPHLPQGAPTSPALANLAAFRFDCRLTGLAQSANISFTRYADDLLFSGDKHLRQIARRFQSTVGAIAIEEGFQVNFRKTQLMSSSQRQIAAGTVLNQKPNLRRDEYDRLRAILHNCICDGPESQNRSDLPDFAAHLLGKVNWVKQLNPAHGKKLLAMFSEIQWEQSNKQS